MEPKIKQDIIQSAQELCESPVVYLVPENSVDLNKISRKAAQIARVQRRIKEVVLAGEGNGLRRVGASVMVRLGKKSHDLRGLMEEQYKGISYVAAGMQTVLGSVKEARQAADAYWNRLGSEPAAMNKAELDALSALELKSEEKRVLANDHYDVESDPTGYFSNLIAKRESERAIMIALSERQRAHAGIAGLEEKLEWAHTLLYFLDQTEARVRDWLDPIQESRTKLDLARRVLPNLAEGSSALAQFVELSDNVIEHTSALTSSEFKKSYRAIAKLGSPPGMVVEPGAQYSMPLVMSR